MLLYNETKLRSFRERAHQAHTVATDLSDRIREKEREIERQKLSFTIQRQDGRQITEDKLSDDERQRLDNQIAPLRDELSFLEAELRTANKTRNSLGPIARACDDWLQEAQKRHQVKPDPDAALAEPIAHNKRHQSIKRLDELRGEIGNKRAERDAVEAAPLPSSEVKAELRGWLDRQASEFNARQIVATAMVPDQFTDCDALRKFTQDGGLLNLAPVIAFACRDTFAERLDELVDEMVDDDQALTQEQRRQRLAEIDAELTKLGQEEERLVCGLEAAGELMERREDADPAILLEVREVEDEPPQHRPPQGSPRGSTTREAEAVSGRRAGDVDAHHASRAEVS